MPDPDCGDQVDECGDTRSSQGMTWNGDPSQGCRSAPLTPPSWKREVVSFAFGTTSADLEVGRKVSDHQVVVHLAYRDTSRRPHYARRLGSWSALRHQISSHAVASQHLDVELEVNRSGPTLPHSAFVGLGHAPMVGFKNGPWTLERVEDTPIATLGLDTDGDDNSHLAFIRRDGFDVQLVSGVRDSPRAHPAATWLLTRAPIAHLDDVTTIENLSLLVHGEAVHAMYHVEYPDGGRSVHHSMRIGAQPWTHTIVDNAIAGELAEDASDNVVHACFTTVALDQPEQTQQAVVYATFEVGGQWLVEQIDRGQFVRGCSVAVDTGGQPHLAYYNDDQVRYASRTAATDWLIDPVGSVPSFASMAPTDVEIDANGFVHLVFVDGAQITNELVHLRSGGF